ncbi:MAG TPA: c-type cytochrome domain-containing protein [Isosphaeraceae bacterium]|nr:c-type cytochrome domain-containing protein [Isosphaeraceae bacterium]
MSLNLRSQVVRGLLFTAAWLALVALPIGNAPTSRARDLGPQDFLAQYPGGQDFGGQQELDMQVPDESGDLPQPGRRARSRSAITKKARRATAKPAADSAEKMKKGATAAPATKKTEAEKSGSTSAGISFRNDVAPILVANCVGCHSQGRPGLARGKLDLTSFAKLMQGTPKENVIAPEKPDESHLVLRVKGEETPRMPQGGNNNGLSEEAIGKIEQWIKTGARLDAGLDPKVAMETYAASPEQVRRNQLARMSTKDREQKVNAAGRDRWKQTNPKLTPEITSSEHFVLFSNLPKDRAANAITAAEAQHSQLKRLLGLPATDWVEKVSLYVFNDRKNFVEFARATENREVDASVSSSGHLTVPQPYVVVVDPLAGRKEEPAASRRKPRSKRGEEKEAPAGADRTLAGLLAENLGESTVAAQGKSPRWLAYGVGLFLSSQVEPRSPYYQKLRDLAREKYSQGWPSKATEALGEGDQVSAEEIRAVGFAVVEFLMTPEFRASFPAFAQGMSKGKEKLDDVLKEVYRADREVFLNQSGDWVAATYGQDQ